MKETDWRKTLEVIVKGLVAVVVGLAGLYILGWILSLLGGILLGLAGIIVALLRWLVPVAIIVGIVYFAVTQLQSKTVQAVQPVTPPPAPSNLEESAAGKVVEIKAETEAVTTQAEPVIITQAESVTAIQPEAQIAPQEAPEPPAEEPKSKPSKASKAKVNDTETPTEPDKQA